MLFSEDGNGTIWRVAYSGRRGALNFFATRPLTQSGSILAICVYHKFHSSNARTREHGGDYALNSGISIAITHPNSRR
jgi:hypothetical protein